MAFQPIQIDTTTAGPTGALPDTAKEVGGNLDSIQKEQLQTQEINQAILLELRAIRFAIVALVCEGGKNTPDDFNPSVTDFGTPGTIS